MKFFGATAAEPSSNSWGPRFLFDLGLNSLRSLSLPIPQPVYRCISTIFFVLQTLAASLLLFVVTLPAIWGDIQRRRQAGTSFFGMLVASVRFMFSEQYVAGVAQLVRDEGYECELHSATTEDGYILGMHRVLAKVAKNGYLPSATTNSRSAPLQSTGSTTDRSPTASVCEVTPRSRGAVLLQHGLFQTSMPYVLNGAGRALAFVLADEGFDVWLGNNRGNMYSRRHKSLDPSDVSFWDFCIDDLAADVEGQIDYIRKRTGVHQVIYVGHSQGGAQGVCALSTRESLRAKVKLFIALAPGAFVQPFTNVWMRRLMSLALSYPMVFHGFFGHGTFVPPLEVARCFLGIRAFSWLAYAMFHYLFEWSDSLWERNRNVLYFYETPSACSVRVIKQWMQQVGHARFGFYDYGTAHENKRRYGTPSPPEYPLHKLSTPTAVIYGGKDKLLDFDRLISGLPNVVYSECIEHHEHMDSLNGRDCVKFLYPRLLDLMMQY